jgi:uncharacterized membrane protein YeaQ/YmgE (transglycosylase-associated protein family)
MDRIKETIGLVALVIAGTVGSIVGGFILLAFIYVGVGLVWDAIAALVP